MREILYECRFRGNVVRVSAIDPETNTEVTIMGPASVGEATLRHIAARKLRYVLEKQKRQGAPQGGKGGIVV